MARFVRPVSGMHRWRRRNRQQQPRQQEGVQSPAEAQNDIPPPTTTEPEYDDDFDEDDNITIIERDMPQQESNQNPFPGGAWMFHEGMWFDLTQETQVHEDQRREVIRREVRHIQKANCFHFSVMMIVPLVLTIIVIIAVLKNYETCISSTPGITCAEEERIFMNAYTTRCICNGITLSP